jgi:hypothetical protein
VLDYPPYSHPSLKGLGIASSSIFLALLLSFGCEKQLKIGQASLALIQAVKTT